MTMPWLQGRIGGGQDGGMELILVLSLILLSSALYIIRRKPGALADAA
jgi:hypothetical protein